jgi:hypothetical protein
MWDTHDWHEEVECGKGCGNTAQRGCMTQDGCPSCTHEAKQLAHLSHILQPITVHDTDSIDARMAKKQAINLQHWIRRGTTAKFRSFNSRQGAKMLSRYEAFILKTLKEY